jgi:hypothetical protein
LREPFGRPLGLPDWPGLNWVNSLPVTCFPPVDSGLRLTLLRPNLCVPQFSILCRWPWNGIVIHKALSVA